MKPTAAKIETDFLVVGSGVAGLRAAIELGRAGRVLMLTKGQPLESNSMYAQGGVAVALSEEDDVAIHLADTLKAGHGLCRREAVRVLVEEVPERIQELISWGAKFDKIGKRFAFTREAAHSRSRILRARGMPRATRWSGRSWRTYPDNHGFNGSIGGLRRISSCRTAVVAGPSY
ncbi:MAG: FAD-binding protein [Nitrospiraceae bacterium]